MDINHRWLVVIGSNLNLVLRLLFCPTITTNNNLPLRICCKNVVKIVCTYHFFKKKKNCGMELQQQHCRNKREKNCSNWFVAMPLPKQGGNLWQLWQCHCRKWEEKKIVVAEIWEGMKKKSVTSTIFLQQITCNQLLTSR